MKKLIVLLACVVVFPAFGEVQQVSRTVAAPADGAVEIELIAGDVEIAGWSRSEVQVDATLDDRFEELEISSDEDGVSIEVEFKRGRRKGNYGGNVKLKIRIPEGSSIELETVSADISIADVSGEIEVEAVSGDLEIRSSSREIDAAVVSGSIDVRSSQALRSGDFETVSGDIDFRGAVARGARLSFESLNGTVSLRLPAETCARFDVETFNGDIKNEFGPRAEKVSSMLPAKELSFSTGNCDTRIDIEVFNGVAELKKE